MIKYPFQYFFDVKTDTSMQVISVKAGGALAQARTLPLWGLYKYYKLGPVSIKMVPSVTIPMDPLGLSYDDDDPNSVDPRDMVSPGLIRITNGEDLDESFVNESADIQRSIYNNMLLDRRWFKWNLQTGVRRSAHPLFYNVGQLHQDAFPGSVVNYPVNAPSGSSAVASLGGVGSMAEYMFNNATDANGVGINNYMGATRNVAYSDPRGFFQTGHHQRMGWMPTDQYVQVPNPDTTEGADPYKYISDMAPCLEADCIKIITPPQYKTSWYFRVYVTEVVYFKGMRSFYQNGVESISSVYPQDYQMRGRGSPDQFISPGVPVPLNPPFGYYSSGTVHMKNNGGGDSV